MWPFLGGAVSALGSIFGASQNADAQEAINSQNIAFQQQTNQQNIAEQEKFAQDSIQWRVADAQKAGVSPLAALGAAGSSFSNVVAPQASQAPQPGTGFMQGAQGLGRAIAAIQDPADKQLDQMAKSAQIQKTNAEADYYRSQSVQARAPGTPPGIPQFSEAGVKAGVTPDAQLTQTARGDITVTPPKEISALGFFHPASVAWSIRNGLMPFISDSYAPQSQRGKDYNPFTMTYSKHPENQSTFWKYMDRNNWLGLQ